MRIPIAVLLLVILGPGREARKECRPQGVWQLVSGAADGTAYPSTMRQMKVITKTHFAFVREESNRGVKEMTSPADSLQAFRTMFAGGGTYTLQGMTYTENFEYFADPAYVGRSVSFTCRTEGNRLYQNGIFPILRNGQRVRDAKLEEIYRRIE